MNRRAAAFDFAQHEKIKAFNLLARPGVLRKNFRLDATLGSLVKQRMLMRWPSSSQP
jgi:hypothetical protein